MRLPRLTTRRLMVIVGVAGLGIGGGILGQRSWAYRGRAAYHERIERRELAQARMLEDFARGVVPTTMKAQVLDYAAYEARVGRYHATMKAKYFRASFRPWESIPPDPPPPKLARE